MLNKREDFQREKNLQVIDGDLIIKIRKLEKETRKLEDETRNLEDDLFLTEILIEINKTIDKISKIKPPTFSMRSFHKEIINDLKKHYERLKKEAEKLGSEGH